MKKNTAHLPLSGFTLLELAIVLMVLALIMSAVLFWQDGSVPA
jgi:prepilin-type N-terminal cleavage/methylation domain-containing protein